mmetsp:Transcript_4687/g.10491  ORF Transcript_4687/g.10491 Transcript_4687/m.10491 type:complete len:84 (+) Transcript_4687:74-325(+)
MTLFAFYGVFFILHCCTRILFRWIDLSTGAGCGMKALFVLGLLARREGQFGWKYVVPLFLDACLFVFLPYGISIKPIPPAFLL